MLTLPRGVISILCSHVGVIDRAYLRATCKKMHDLVEDNAIGIRWIFSVRYNYQLFDDAKRWMSDTGDYISQPRLEPPSFMINCFINQNDGSLDVRDMLYELNGDIDDDDDHCVALLECLMECGTPLNVVQSFRKMIDSQLHCWTVFEYLTTKFVNDNRCIDWLWHEIELIKPTKKITWTSVKRRKKDDEEEWTM